MDIIDFYRSILKDVNIIDPAEDGYLSALHAGNEIPLEVGGKRLVLPLRELLKSANWDKCIAFHPMAEKINRGESEVLKALKDYIYLQVNMVGWALLTDLLKAAADNEKIKRVGPEAEEYLKAVGGADAKTVEALTAVSKATSKDPNRRLISIYLKHGSTGKEGYARQSIVSFPIMDEFEIEESTIFGVKMSKKAKSTIQKLLEYVFGNEDVRKTYSFGSNILEAPYLHALLNSFYKLALRLNTLTKMHEKLLTTPEALRFDLGWSEHIENLSAFRGLIPSQPGNEGKVLGEEADTLKDQAKEIYSRRREEPTDVPWDEDRRTGVEDRRRGFNDRSDEPSRSSGNAIGFDEFKQQFQRREENRRGGFFREERGNSFSRQFDGNLRNRDDDRDSWGRGSRRDSVRSRGGWGGGRSSY